MFPHVRVYDASHQPLHALISLFQSAKKPSITTPVPRMKKDDDLTYTRLYRRVLCPEHLPQYTHLTRVELSEPQSPNPSAVELVSLLERCPLLEELSLINLDMDLPEVPAERSIIRLPHVKKFELKYISPTAIAYILKSVYISCMAPIFCRHDSIPQSSGCIDIGHEVSLQINERRVTLHVRAQSHINLDLSDNSTPIGSSVSIIGNLGSAVDLSLVPHLRYDNDNIDYHARKMGDWNALLSHMHSLTTVELNMEVPNQLDVAHTIFLALSPRNETQPSTSRLCPQLKHLCLDLSGRHNTADTTSLFRSLACCLQARRSLCYTRMGLAVVLPTHFNPFEDEATIRQLMDLAEYVDFYESVRTTAGAAYQ